MDKSEITDEEIESVLTWYHGNGTADTKLKKAYYKKKGRKLRKRLGWKFYAILQEMFLCIQEEGA